MTTDTTPTELAAAAHDLIGEAYQRGYNDGHQDGASDEGWGVDADSMHEGTAQVQADLAAKFASLTPATDERLREAAQGVIDQMSGTYTARNGKRVGIEADDGEKCWIVHSDAITALEAALNNAPPAQLRTDERLAELLGEIRAEQVQLAMLVGSIKMEWASSGHWSEWDQQRQNSVHAFIARIDTVLANREQSK